MEQNTGRAPAPHDGDLPVLAYLEGVVSGGPPPGDPLPMRYPTAISRLLDFEIVEVGAGTAAVRVVADPALHGNQQGTVHGGFLAELADAAIGTARSTLIRPGESFTSIDLRVVFLRPVWSGELVARARPAHAGRTITHYACEVVRADGKTVATVTSAVMTLRGDGAAGR
ncbi:PaaI family thioesterase [Nocardiopsis flavescens]|uniref:PaaI family thioesterase n=1 Tax=Nocardiopsis flavescens TaxID=758803 RepID=UPI00365ED8DD